MITGERSSTEPWTRRRSFGKHWPGAAPIGHWPFRSPLSCPSDYSGQLFPNLPHCVEPEGKAGTWKPQFYECLSYRFLVLIMGLEKWCVFYKISFYTSYCNWQGSSSFRRSLAAGKKWLYVMGKGVIGVLGKRLLQKPLFTVWFICASWGFWLRKEKKVSKW